MKKLILLLTMLCSVFIYGCKKDRNETAARPLIGYWDNQWVSQPGGNRFITTYTFRPDGTFTYQERVHDNEVRLLGFKTIIKGKYMVRGNQINFYDQEIYENDYTKGSYAAGDKLVKNPEMPSFTFQFKINKAGQLEITPRCPPTALCVGLTAFNRSATD